MDLGLRQLGDVTCGGTTDVLLTSVYEERYAELKSDRVWLFGTE